MTVDQPHPNTKAPRSEAQRQQARINGARSRGPRTAAGKARSCRNSTRHGYRAETLVAPGDVPRLEDLREGILADLPRPIRAVDRLAAADIASAAIRVEKIGAFRISAVAEARREIREEHDRQLEQIASDAIRLLAEGDLVEGYELRRKLPRGCEQIAEIWSEIRDELAMLSGGSKIPEATWRAILASIPTLEPIYQASMRPLYEEASRTGSIDAATLIGHCDVYIRTLLDRAARLARDHRRLLRHRRIAAEADLGPDGQLRDRYLQMARSTIARNVREMDVETHRQWRRDKDGWPAPNEPEEPPQAEAGSLAEGVPGNSSATARACERSEAPAVSIEPEGCTRAVAEAGAGMPPRADTHTQPPAPNEPEASAIDRAPEPATPAPNEPEAKSVPTIPGRRPVAPNEPGAPSRRTPSPFPPGFAESLRPPWLKDDDEDDEKLLDDASDLLKPSAMGRWMAERVRELFPESPAPNEPGEPAGPPSHPRAGPGHPPQEHSPWPDPGQR